MSAGPRGQQGAHGHRERDLADLFIAGGGISRKADKWIPLLTNRTPVVAATLQNTAGIVGAAMAAEVDVTATAK